MVSSRAFESGNVPAVNSQGYANGKMAGRRSVRDLPTSVRPASTDEPNDVFAVKYPGFGKLFLLYTAVGVLTSLRYQFQRPPHMEIGDLAFTVAFTACYYPWVVLTPLVFRIERRFPLGSGNWLRNSVLLAIFSVPICLAASPVILGIFFGTLSVLEPTFQFRAPRFWFSHFPMAQALFWCSVAGGYLLRTQFQLRVQEQKASRLALEKSQLEAGLKQAQLDVIRARLNPHFLFNSLQNISVMTKQDPQTASRMLVRLGDLLRAVLRQDSEPESTLHDEIELTRDYVALEQMRFGERLEVLFNIAPETQQAMVPCFLLQPLIENAVIHGLRGARKTGKIAVSSSVEGRQLVMAVTDNGIGPPEDGLSGIKMGVGLGSTRERLATMYPDRHAFSMRKSDSGGTEVVIAIPLRFAGPDDRALHDELPAIADR
jgi:signal transduction histidine kinase